MATNNTRSHKKRSSRLAVLVCLSYLFALLVLFVANAPAAEPQRLTTDGLLKQRPVWSPDGSSLVFARHQGSTIFLFIREADGSERRLTKSKDPEFDAAWSPDGKRLVFTFDKTVPNQGDMDVYSIAADGSDLTPVLASPGKLTHEEWPSWSPDGSWIALSSTRDGNQEIYIVRPDGKDLKRLTSDPAIDAHPTWSPDGKRIVFATNRWGDLELAAVGADGNGLVRLTQSPGLDDYPAWSPDGETIAFTTQRDGNAEVYCIDPDGKSPRNMTRNSAIDTFPAWTPASELTFVSNRSGGFDIYKLQAAK